MNFAFFIEHQPDHSIPIIPVDQTGYKRWLDQHATAMQRESARNLGFQPAAHRHLCLCDANGSLELVLTGIDETSIWSLAHLPGALPDGDYHLEDLFALLDAEQAYLGYALGHYRFDRYLSHPAHKPGNRLFLPPACHHLEDWCYSLYLVRNLVNTPADDLGPAALAQTATALAEEFGAECRVIVGEELLNENYPAVHTVGRAGSEAPRLIDLSWGDLNHPKLTLVGKGVCFDSGGLDIKPASGMLTMLKDMGGSAYVLGLARLIMARNLPLRLRVLIPAVENAISANAYRPSDIIRTRSGKSVQVLNTDAEGRLILADALSEAADDNPDLLLDVATLTGACRIALGLEVPVYFSTDTPMREQLLQLGEQREDPVWPLPLHQPYRRHLTSEVADLANVASHGPYGGGIIAALFLQAFTGNTNWVHFDLGAWNDSSQPGRPKGGECMGLRTIYHFIEQHFAQR